MNTAINTRNASHTPTAKTYATMNRLLCRLAALALLLGGVAQARAGIMYTVENYPAYQDGAHGGDYTITGTITTDGTVGAITTADIVAWNLTASDPTSGNPTVMLNSSDSGASASITTTGNGTVTATATAITATITDANPGNEAEITLSEAGGASYAFGVAYLGSIYNHDFTTAYASTGEEAWNSDSGGLSSSAPGATYADQYAKGGVSTAVPEPSTVVLGLLALAGSGVVGLWKKFRRA